MRIRMLSLVVVLLAAACSSSPSEDSAPVDARTGTQGNSAPTEHTIRANADVAASLDLASKRDFEEATRGFVAREDNLVIRTEAGSVVWDMPAYSFEAEEAAPPSVNPSLWRQVRLNNLHGLFEVTPGIHQVRGYDLSNMTLIEGRSGWILVDPLTTRETASAAIALARKHLGDKPIRAIILTHSHIDHFGGIQAVVDPEADKDVRIVAPLGFLEEATSENVLAGIGMGRRASFMYGFDLERSTRGHVGTGLGKSPAKGTFGILPPTDIVDTTGQEMEIDGVRFVFQYVPDSEAPAELNFYLPDLKAFCGAELVSHTLHNLYTLRGAKVRDGLAWSAYIHEAIGLFPETEILFASHQWPTWGRERVREHLEKQRDTYKFIHDQTLRMANAGFTPREIAEVLTLPEALDQNFAGRGYYGTVRHNAKAVYQWYFGWYDGNPANLDPLPPTEEAIKYVEFMGGPAAVMEKAKASFDAGDYRWTATVLNHLVFAAPGNKAAADLLASTYDQLGYQAESGPWRDVYLTAALELRGQGGGSAVDIKAASDLLRHMPIRRFFDSMASRIDGIAAKDTDLTLNFVFTDAGESYALHLKGGVLNYRKVDTLPNADVTLKLTKELWLKLATGRAGVRDLVFSGDLDVDGSRLSLVSFFRLLDNPKGDFEIVRP